MLAEERDCAAAAGIAVAARPKAESAPEACSIRRRVSCGCWPSGPIRLLFTKDMDSIEVYLAAQADLIMPSDISNHVNFDERIARNATCRSDRCAHGRRVTKAPFEHL